MGALAAVVDKEGKDVYDKALTLLGALSHRGADAFGIASNNKLVIRDSLEELYEEKIESSFLICHNHAKTLPRDEPQPLKNQGFTLVFEGRLFPVPPKAEAVFVAEKLAKAGNEPKWLIEKFYGDYVFALAEKNRIVVGRDSVGTRPLYFCEGGELCAVASERKALRRIGLEKAAAFPPGRLAVIDKEGFHFEAVKTLIQPPLQKAGIETSAKLLEAALIKATKKRVSDIKEVAVAFSGGIDSSMIAQLAKHCGAETHLIYVTLESEEETTFAELAAEALDLPFHVATYTIEDVRKILPKILWLTEEPSPLSASIAIPIYWTAYQAAKLGFHVLMTGQGGDELFGGYHRYLQEYAKHGPTGLQRRLYKDVLSSHEDNFQRDNKMCAVNNVELRLPMADWQVTQLALSLPLEMKIVSPKDALRKRVLRYAAANLGVPKFIVEKPKKAIQYTTGVNRVMKKIAKKESLTLRKYVEETFMKTLRMLD